MEFYGRGCNIFTVICSNKNVTLIGQAGASTLHKSILILIRINLPTPVATEGYFYEIIFILYYVVKISFLRRYNINIYMVVFGIERRTRNIAQCSTANSVSLHVIVPSDRAARCRVSAR